jgi:hypothetical protein
MARQNQPPRYESSLLAAGLAVAGSLYVSDKLSSLVRGALTFQVILQAAGILLIATGICLLLVEWPERTPEKPTRIPGASNLNAKGSSS